MKVKEIYNWLKQFNDDEEIVITSMDDDLIFIVRISHYTVLIMTDRHKK